MEDLYHTWPHGHKRPVCYIAASKDNQYADRS